MLQCAFKDSCTTLTMTMTMKAVYIDWQLFGQPICTDTKPRSRRTWIIKLSFNFRVFRINTQSKAYFWIKLAGTLMVTLILRERIELQMA